MLLATPTGQAQTVLSRTRLGNSTEDITYVTGGIYKDYLAVVDGIEVYGAPGKGKAKASDAVVKLFDLPSNVLDIAPRGIAYIGSEDLFAFNDPTQNTKLFLCDATGKYRGTRTIKYLNNFVPGHIEGMVYLPKSSSFFPDHLIMVAMNFNDLAPSRLEIMRPDGQAVAEIIPEGQPSDGNFILGVAYQSSNRLVVSYSDLTMKVIDFNGHVLLSPALPAGVNGFEALVETGDGSIAAAGHDEGTIFYYDKDFNRVPQNDRPYNLGIGVSQAIGLAWNTDTNEHVIARQNPGKIFTVPTTLTTATEFANPTNDGAVTLRRMTYLPAEHLTAVVDAGQRTLLLYNSSGVLAETINLQMNGFGAPFAVAYIPSTNQFAVKYNGIASDLSHRHKLHILSRTGQFVRTIDLGIGTLNVTSVAFFNPAHPSGGQFLIIAAPSRVMLTDFNGNLLREFNSRVKLGVINPNDVSTITTGPQAGAFGMLDSENSSLVVFTLD
jgi:hypothetical protein